MRERREGEKGRGCALGKQRQTLEDGCLYSVSERKMEMLKEIEMGMIERKELNIK